MDDLLKVVIPAFAGLVAGMIGSLIAPWVNWGIEKRKLKLAARREFVASVRDAVKTIDDKDEFREHATYSQLRPFLSERTRVFLESDTLTFQSGGRGGGVNNYKPKVFDDLHSLERKWDLL